MGWCGNLDSSMVKSAMLVIWRSVVQIPVQVQIGYILSYVTISTHSSILFLIPFVCKKAEVRSTASFQALVFDEI